jgi:citrate lyase subunit beta / citryl-CoA lyase
MSADPYGSGPESLDGPDDLRTLVAAPRPTTPHRPVDPAIARSWLLVPGTRVDLFDENAASRADAVVLDIEDAVDPSNKPKARQDVADWLRAGGRAWVRVNDVSSPFWSDDLAVLAGIPNLLGIMLAKTETPDQVTRRSTASAAPCPWSPSSSPQWAWRMRHTSPRPAAPSVSRSAAATSAATPE